ncbi:hypothetical protein BU16DRAFT_546862 [Lophium mytilinum]|uniref:Tyrosine--tRNA ligase n=1 Tax=Lophium mytilinum TaxID=390894 RepID=A0A6A6RAB7_9PEZI|nr:hypothetical protein BU16DRAFT_546862 [Lophium mytilinum]
MLAILEERGFIKDVAGGRDELDNLLTSKRIGAYVGVDPTAPSLHVGHLLPLMALFWMYLHGFGCTTLLGGATAKVGDPSGRLSARDAQKADSQKMNMIAMHVQLRKLWSNVDALAGRFGYQKEWAWKRALLNNNAWLNKLGITEVLRDLGPGLRLGTMLAKDTHLSVKTRLEKGDGMSFAEFCYPLLQSWDWWHMYQANGIQLQIGGSDQYGNICAGMDAINYMRKTYHAPHLREGLDGPLMAPFGFTTPLLTTSSGEKFGKSAGNAIWLDPELLSSFELYGFFVKSSDDDIERYLKLFTFIPLPEIKLVMTHHRAQPEQRHAQHLVAKEFVSLVHGVPAAEKAEKEHKALFAGGSKTLNLDALKNAPQSPGKASSGAEEDMSMSLNTFAPQVNAQNAPQKYTSLPKSLVMGSAFPQILYSAGLVSSRSEGHRLVSAQGAYVAGQPDGDSIGNSLNWSAMKHFETDKPQKYILDGNLLVVRVGKWNIRMCHILEDEDFEAQGLTCPGWEDFKERERAKADAAAGKGNSALFPL